MIVYRDMCFCPFWGNCKEGKDCLRALTDKEKERAKKIGLPVEQFAEKPECFESQINHGRS